MNKVKVIKLPKREFGLCVVQNVDTLKKASFHFDQYGITGFISGNWFIDMFDNDYDKMETQIMIKIGKQYKW